MDHPLNYSPFLHRGVFRVNRWLVLSVAMAGLLLAVAVRSSIRATARRKRETGYSKTLQAYVLVAPSEGAKVAAPGGATAPRVDGSDGVRKTAMTNLMGQGRRF